MAAAGDRRGSRLACVALALLTLWGTTLAVRSLLPWPAARGVAAKRAWWEQHGDTVDVLLIGSSRVARGYVPALIEQELAAAGHELTVFNWGVIGMGAYEADHVLRWILDRDPSRLAVVVLEPESWRPERPDKAEHLTARDVYWHDARLTGTALEAIARTGAPWEVQLAGYREHLDRFGMRWTNLGAGSWWLEQGLSAPDPEDPPAALIAEHRGWQPYDGDHGQAFAGQLRQWELRGAESPYGRRVEALRGQRPQPGVLARFHVEAVRRQVAAVRAAGALPVHAIGPSVRPKPWIAALDAAGELPRLIDLQDPDRFPALYDPHNRYDTDHMNTAGAELLSRLLGRRLAAVLEAAEDGR